MTSKLAPLTENTRGVRTVDETGPGIIATSADRRDPGHPGGSNSPGAR
ncbi:hypothetical protein ACWIGI_25755 [Nocardia sp. NPDC055321]